MVEDKEARNHSNISFDKFHVELHDCHFWIRKCSSLQELTHVGRWTQISSGAPNSWLHQPRATHTSSTTWSTPPTKVCYSILEKLYSETWAKATRQDVNTSKCLNEKWQPHFELKRWVWPMIKCLHLTPKSIYSNIGDFVVIKFSSVSPYSCICLMHICFPFQKKLHLEMVGDKVTYVGVYWLRSQVRSLDHSSYSSFKLKMGLPFFV